METDGFELKAIENEDNNVSVDIQKTRRLLHFSDGVMEELSENEDEPDKSDKNRINDKDLSWAPYIRSKTYKAGNNMLAAIDYVGGGLASFLGITSSELQIAAANQAYMEKVQKADNARCDTWKPMKSDSIVSSEVKSVHHE